MLLGMKRRLPLVMAKDDHVRDGPRLVFMETRARHCDFPNHHHCHDIKGRSSTSHRYRWRYQAIALRDVIPGPRAVGHHEMRP